MIPFGVRTLDNGSANLSSSASSLSTLGADATALTLATHAVVTVRTQAVSFWTDGSNPTAADGIRIPAGETIILSGNAMIRNWRGIAETGTADVSWELYG